MVQGASAEKLKWEKYDLYMIKCFIKAKSSNHVWFLIMPMDNG